MPGTMSRADLAADLKASLHDAAEVFTAASGADFSRLLDVAAHDFARLRPRTLVGSFLLTAGLGEYAVPADFHQYKTDLWADPSRCGRPWEKSYAGRPPTIRAAEVDGTRKLVFFPAPTAQQIAAFGSSFRFYYFARHVINENAEQTSIAAGDRGLLILRAQAEAMRELAMRNIAKPASLRDGLNSQPRNGTPSALYALLLDEFQRAAA